MLDLAFLEPPTDLISVEHTRISQAGVYLGSRPLDLVSGVPAGLSQRSASGGLP